MPFFSIELLEGVSESQKRKMLQDSAVAAYNALGCPPQAIKICVRTIKKEDFSWGGVMLDEMENPPRMAFIQLKLTEGRSDERIKTMVREMNRACAAALETDQKNIYFFVHEFPAARIAVAGPSTWDDLTDTPYSV